MYKGNIDSVIIGGHLENEEYKLGSRRYLSPNIFKDTTNDKIYNIPVEAIKNIRSEA
jgi:hypothetical protein